MPAKIFLIVVVVREDLERFIDISYPVCHSKLIFGWECRLLSSYCFRADENSHAYLNPHSAGPCQKTFPSKTTNQSKHLLNILLMD